jgi:hypothetical protein
MNIMNNKIISFLYLIILPVILIVAIVGAPSWYFQVLRWIIFISFLYGSYKILNLKNASLGVTLIALAFLYNPVFQFYMNRENWIFLDIVSIVTSIGVFIFMQYFIKRN